MPNIAGFAAAYLAGVFDDAIVLLKEKS